MQISEEPAAASSLRMVGIIEIGAPIYIGPYCIATDRGHRHLPEHADRDTHGDCARMMGSRELMCR
jgi:hypothetical protein